MPENILHFFALVGNTVWQCLPTTLYCCIIKIKAEVAVTLGKNKKITNLALTPTLNLTQTNPNINPNPTLRII